MSAGTVFLLWHEHDIDGEKDSKHFGVYSSEERTPTGLVALARYPASWTIPHGFLIDRYDLDDDRSPRVSSRCEGIRQVRLRSSIRDRLDRIQALEDLIMHRAPVHEAIPRVEAFPWDSETELVPLTRADGRRTLDAYLEGHLTSDAVGQWANAIECRDDIGFEEGAEILLKDFLFELAQPEITRQLTRSSAIDWRQRLG